jgi:hypothetical protein
VKKDLYWSGMHVSKPQPKLALVENKASHMTIYWLKQWKNTKPI